MKGKELDARNIQILAAQYEHDEGEVKVQVADKCIHYKKLEVKYFPEIKGNEGLCHKEFGRCILEKSILRCSEYSEQGIEI